MRIKPPQGAALARVKPYPQASALKLVQPSTSFRPFRFAPRMGEPPRLDSCYPGPRRSGRVFAISETQLLFQKGTNFYGYQSRYSLWLRR